MKTILITGTTNGIGKVTAEHLAQQGHRLVLANRNRDKSAAQCKALASASGNDNIEWLELDLASLDSVRRCAEHFNARYSALDILINNAGLTSMEQVITADRLELQFQVNALAQLEFTQLLLPALVKAAPAHVIFVTSMAHRFGKLQPDRFTGWPKYRQQAAYNQSKLAMMLLARELAERLRGQGVAINTLHPGAVNTGILDGFSRLAQFFLRRLFITPEKGARTTLYLAGMTADDMPTGKYFVKRKMASTHALVNNAAARASLWDTCSALLKSR